ncbi:MAG: serine hydrolase domain-containing protein [Myxococcaceae bacterium]|nr:serine hydrolase domain-containing protein [Myxococcaceae bacterium]
MVRALVAGVVVLLGCAPAGPGADADGGMVDGAPDAAADGGPGDAGAVAPAWQTRVARLAGDGGVEVRFPSGTETVAQLPAVIVGVIRGGFVEVATASRPGAPALDRRTVLPLSSVTKAVTGLMAAREVADGRLAAATPASTLLGGDLAPLVGDRTLVELASHTAGYLNLPRNLDFMTLPYEPGAAYTRARLADCLARAECSVGAAQRGTYQYSDLGSGLLALALADGHGGDFEALVAARFTGPLGLSDTRLRNSADLTRAVSGLTPRGDPVGPASMGVLAGAGGLLSTCDDMLRLLEVLLRPTPEWRAAVELAVAPTTGTGAIGWSIDRVRLDGRLVFLKTGEQAGYSTLLLWSPADDVGLIAFTTVGRSSRTLVGLALELLEAFRGP